MLKLHYANEVKMQKGEYTVYTINKKFKLENGSNLTETQKYISYNYIACSKI